MANDARAIGLIPIRQPYGSMRVGYYRANTGQNIFRGQVVALNNSGQVQVADVVANTPALGVVVGFLDATQSGLPSDMTSLNQGAFLESNNDAFVAVTDDPQQLYLVQEETGGSALTVADVGAGFLLTYETTTGNTTTGYTTLGLDRSTITTGTDGLVQAIAIQNIINQDGTTNAPGDYCKWVVRIANHQLNGTKLSVLV